MKRVFVPTLILMALSLVAVGQEPVPTATLPTAPEPGRNQVYGGFIIETTDWGGSWGKYYGFDFNYTRSFTKRFGAVVDIDYLRNNGSTLNDIDQGTAHNSHEFAYRTGPRYNVLVHHRFQPYIEGLFGGANFTSKVPYPGRLPSSPIVQKDWFGFTYALGGGVDYHLTKHLGVRGEWLWTHVPWGTEKTDASAWDRATFGATWRW